MAQSRLRIRGLEKSYATPVLQRIDLDLAAGEIHALVGENGAGKSTLVNVLAGMVRKDGGEIFLDDEPYAPAGPAEALERGVSFAAQELSIIGTLSVAENILLRRLPHRGGIVARSELVRRAGALIDEVGLEGVSPEDSAAGLSLADRQLVEIAKSLATSCRLLLLDEPTAALTAPQAEHLHALLKRMRSAGTTIVYVSHRLDDVLRLADAVSVLRDGRIVAGGAAGEFSTDDLLRHMSGQAVTPASSPEKSGERGARLLELDGITTAELPHPISLDAHAGEIIGLAGLAGSGRSELLGAAFGLAPLSSGRVARWAGSDQYAVQKPGDAAARGMAYLGEDRQAMGLFAGRSVLMNIMVPGDPKTSQPLAALDRRRERRAAEDLRTRLDIRCRDLDQTVDELSGGNQQKALIARWLHRDADVYLLDEPTRGVDVGTRFAIYELLAELRRQGRCILMASSEIEELMTVCDRILVLSDRRLAGAFERGDWSEAAILAAAFEAHKSRGKAEAASARGRA